MHNMTVTRDINASIERVWDVLADGWTYSQWVVGNSRIRAVDPDWPEAGSTIRHSVGVWPLVINDETVVEKSVPARELVLLAKTGPIGAARVTLRLTPTDGGCQIRMSEAPVKGPAKLMPNALASIPVDIRNRECLWRLASLAEQKLPAEVTR